MKKAMLLLLVCSPAWAVVNKLEYEYGRGSPRGSYHFGDWIKQEGPRGPEWSADFLHESSERVYVGIGGGHFHSGDEVSQTLVPNTDATFSTRMTSILALGRLDLSSNPKLMPYAIVGIGWVRYSLVVQGVPATSWSDTGTSESRTLVDDAKNTVGYTAGLGVDLAVTDRLYIGIDARYQGAVKQHFDTSAAGQVATGTKELTVPLGAFLLGAKVGVKY